MDIRKFLGSRYNPTNEREPYTLATPYTMEPATSQILFQLNVLGFHVRYEGDGQAVTLTATHRLAGHFFAYTATPGNEYEAVHILAEMCGIGEFS